MHPTRRHSPAESLGAAPLLGAAGAAPGAGHFSKFDGQARPILAQMTLDEKIGQMTQPDQAFLHSLDDIEAYHLGSLLSGGDSDPVSGNDLLSWTGMVDGYQARTRTTRLRLPLLYGVDAVHGHNNVIGAVVFPHNIGLGCTRNAKLVERAAQVTAEEVRATGINWAFAPCLAAPQDIRWGRTYEGFSESPEVVKLLGEAAVRGLERGALDHPLAVVACAKHFIGDGGTAAGTGTPWMGSQSQRLDQGDTRVDETTLRSLHLPGYLTALAAGAGTVMPSYSSWNGEKCSGNRKLITSLLKEELGFEGFVISDYNALDQLPGDRKQQIERSINAGMDMVMVASRYREFFTALRELVAEGRVPQSRIDDAVMRILRVKAALGLLDPKRSPLADRTLHRTFGGAEHRALARQCVRESVVLVANNAQVLPIPRDLKRIHVAGRNADDLGNQCGGWTIRWQGQSGTPTLGTTILAGIRQVVSWGTQVTTSRDGSGAEGANIAVAVIGEAPPYAEGNGDRASLALAAEDVATVENLKRAGIPVIVVLLSGRPLLIEPLLGKADAILAAWYPGTEGDGVVDVLFGFYRPTGKLSFTWPRAETSSYARSDAGYKALFPFGHGLSY